MSKNLKDSEYMKETELFSKPDLWNWVKAICTVISVIVISYKIYSVPMNIVVDFPTLLSLLLAIFSVALSALFYFKATETSNTFYDNTYKFTKDIAQLLAKIESGFGEKLRSLDEGYSSVRDYIQNNSTSSNEIDITKKEIKKQSQEFKKVLDERNEIVNKVLQESQLKDEEKKVFTSQLAEKEKELKKAHEKLSEMDKKLFIERIATKSESQRSIPVERYTLRKIVDPLGPEYIKELSDTTLRIEVESILDEAPSGYIRDLKEHGFFDNGLTKDGLHFIRMIAEKRSK